MFLATCKIKTEFEYQITKAPQPNQIVINLNASTKNNVLESLASKSNQMVINLNASTKNNVLESLEFSKCTELTKST